MQTRQSHRHLYQDITTASVRRRTGTVASTLVMLLALTSFAATRETVAASAQDECLIGSVTPERYAEIRAEVERLPPVDWDAAHRRWNEIQAEIEGVRAAGTGASREDWRRIQALPQMRFVFGEALAERLRAVMRSADATDEKLARLHAYMRRTGALFTFARANLNPGQPGQGRGAGVVYNYRVDANSLGLFRPICRWARLVVALGLRGASPAGQAVEIGDVESVVVIAPTCFEPGPGVKERPAPSCPPTPVEQGAKQTPAAEPS